MESIEFFLYVINNITVGIGTNIIKNILLLIIAIFFWKGTIQFSRFVVTLDKFEDVQSLNPLV